LVEVSGPRACSVLLRLGCNLYHATLQRVPWSRARLSAPAPCPCPPPFRPTASDSVGQLPNKGKWSSVGPGLQEAVTASGQWRGGSSLARSSCGGRPTKQHVADWKRSVHAVGRECGPPAARALSPDPPAVHPVAAFNPPSVGTLHETCSLPFRSQFVTRSRTRLCPQPARMRPSPRFRSP